MATIQLSRLELLRLIKVILVNEESTNEERAEASDRLIIECQELDEGV